MKVPPVASEPAKAARVGHALAPWKTARGHLIYEMWPKPLRSSYASLRELYEGTMGRARTSSFLYPSGGATPHHKGCSPKKRMTAKKRHKHKHLRNPSAQSTGSTSRSRQSGSLSSSLPATPGQVTRRDECARSRVASAKTRMATTSC